MPPFSFDLVALVATANRSELLESRSLPSILTQTLAPDRIVVVDDSSLKGHLKTQRAIAEIDKSNRIEFLQNRRSPGASGAWNSGLDHILRTSPNPETTFIAILDDDDEWAPDHLRQCSMVASEEQADMVSSAFMRLERDKTPKLVVPPSVLRREDFLIGNPGIQGSNLFIRLSVLLEAGLFDENLASCTDRDLCIRLSELPGLRYASQSIATVSHHASSDIPRLSSPICLAKRQGLESFYRKYSPQMMEPQKQKFLDRAFRYFSWKPERCLSVQKEKPATDTYIDREADHLALVVAVIADENRIGSLTTLLKHLQELSKDPAMVGLDVLLLDNGSGPTTPYPFIELVENARSEGMNVYAITRDIIEEDHETGRLYAPECVAKIRMGIARARTVLQTYLYALLCQRPGAVGWILDDDMHLEALTEQQGETILWKPPYVQILAQAKREGVIDIGIGPYTGAPPLPFAACIRVQMVDLVHTLRRWAHLSPEMTFPAIHDKNARLATGRRDFYYDLSRTETDHLETPFNFALLPGENVAECFSRLAQIFERILAGEQLFRPLVDKKNEDVPWTQDAHPLQRGGNTFIFNPDVLAEVPNPCLLIQGRPMRRSDMLWSLAQQYLCERTVRTLSLPVYHDRSHLPVEGLDADKIIDDIRGYALYSALQDWFREGKRGEGLESCWIPQQDIAAFKSTVEKYAEERLAAFTLSFWRVRGCAKSALHFLEHPDLDYTSWMHGDEFFQERIKLAGVLQRIIAMYDLEELHSITQRIDIFGSLHVERFLEELPQQCRGHRHRLNDTTMFINMMRSQRIELAKCHVRRILGVDSELRVLGQGAEGVALTDEHLVFKVFDYWKSKEARRQINFLSSKINAWTDTLGLYPLKSIVEEGSIVILTYPFEESTPYKGGNGPGLIQLLIECHENGIVCRNIHPKNLRTVGEKVRLIDYGSDIHPIKSKEEFDMMCRRAWLSWRHSHRNDLSEIMNKTLTDHCLPELGGFGYFLGAIKQRLNHTTQYYTKIANIVELLAPDRVLDYGCGKGKILGLLGQKGISGIGYDPDPINRREWESRWEEASQSVCFLSERSLLEDMPPFDVVICTRVLCTLNDIAYAKAVKDLGQMVRTGGTVVVSVCDPEFIDVRHTTEATKLLDKISSKKNATFKWEKRLASGRTRTEFYRTRRRLIRDLSKVGLAVVDEFEIPTIDLERFEPASEIRVFVLKALPQLPEISLMIKCCAMEADTLEVQVQHLIRQLETPRAFAERLLVIDERAENFPRQYAAGDMNTLKVACSRLLDDGWVDRIVFGPKRRRDLIALNYRWFGLRTCATHAASGPQVASTIAGFEECWTPYVLQVDSDIMVGRLDYSHDYIADMLQVFSEHPTAATVAFNIFHAENKPYTDQDSNGPWRTEVRASMMNIERFKALAPFPNTVKRNHFEQTWYRAADKCIKTKSKISWRGGDRRTFFIHPPNDRKVDPDLWMVILDRVEKGAIPHIQYDHVDLLGDLNAWISPDREEKFIFIVGGRNVPPGRFRRCFNSITAQKRNDWGCIVIDDASSPALAENIQRTCAEYAEKITILNIRRRRGLLANMTWAIRLICSNPQSIVVTVDADDMLLSDWTLDRLHEAYEHGADMTIGSMLRTDKHVPYPVNFDDPRQNRGGNVWQHLRSFRKYLFDAIPESMFKLKGRYIDLATDWAYMIPMVELAQNPIQLHHPLYLYEPSGTGKGPDVKRREELIEQIVAKESLNRRSAREIVHDAQ